jgi:DNA-binding HxlR family transcriptional regulator
MYQKKMAPPVGCGIQLTKEVLNGKWKPTLLHHIASGVQRPGALQRCIPEATRRVLTVQLNELEQHGLVGKVIYPQLPLKVTYYLTDLGRSLMLIIEAMTKWGDDNREELERVLGRSSTGLVPEI